MEALADKVHKLGEHIPQHCYISHNHPYISSSDTLGGTISISTVMRVEWSVRMRVEWSKYIYIYIIIYI